MRIHRRNPASDESGYTLVAVLILLMVGSLFAVAAWGASQNDITPSTRDRQAKEAYAAAEAGINYYLFRLGQNNAYWTNCDNVPPPNSTEPNPVNLAGASTLRWRTVPGTTASYAIELLPQNGAAQCLPGDSAASTMIDAPSGTMQFRSTGKSGSVRRTIVATVRRSGFLDYLYFTDYETEDPQVSGSGATCDVYRRDGRSSSCSQIVFADADAVNGPFHTNDDFLACGTPTFGRTAVDKIEVTGPSPGYYNGPSCTAAPVFQGTFTTGAEKLDLPATNTTLQDVANPSYVFTGRTDITFNGTSATVVNNGQTYIRSLDSSSGFNGVFYVKNGPSCSGTYNGTGTQKYDEPTDCGNVYVHGSYSRSVTIGSARDIIVTSDLTRNGSVVMGLVSQFFVRVYHPVNSSCGDATAPYPFGYTPPSSIQIDAAILSIAHSFIVDNYKCGTPRGTLTVNGAIGQKFRGPVGTGGSSISTGYVKNYNYDDRFRVISPPYFVSPVQASWRKIRFNEQVPARQGG